MEKDNSLGIKLNPPDEGTRSFTRTIDQLNFGVGPWLSRHHG